MADKASGEKAGEKSFFARTAKNTTKKAKRAQEKVVLISYTFKGVNNGRAFNASQWRIISNEGVDILLTQRGVM